MLEDMVLGIELQDFEFYAVWVIVLQGDLLQVARAGGAHGGPATTKATCVLYPCAPCLHLVGQETHA